MSHEHNKLLEIQNKFAEHAAKDIPIGSIWKHYKGGLYQIKGFVMQESTEKMQVYYESLDQPLKYPWLRPVSEVFDIMWNNGNMVRRFERIIPKPEQKQVSKKL